jgi:hypothetical protein
MATTAPGHTSAERSVEPRKAGAMAEQERRLDQLREEEARLLHEEHSDAIDLQLNAIRADIETATRDLDEVIRDAQDRARRLDGDGQ